MFSLSCDVIQICEQEVQQPVQGHDWRGFPHQGGAVRGQALHSASKIGLVPPGHMLCRAVPVVLFLYVNFSPD